MSRCPFALKAQTGLLASRKPSSLEWADVAGFSTLSTAVSSSASHGDAADFAGSWGGGASLPGVPLPEDEDRLAETVASLPVVIWGIASPEDAIFEGAVTSGNKASLLVIT